jgi:hypothetical protein
MSDNLSDGMLLEDTSREQNQEQRHRFAAILGILFSVFCAIVAFTFLLGLFSFIGECSDRNNHVKCKDTATVTGIMDNTVREYFDGDMIHPTEYQYVVLLQDSSGNTTKMTIQSWAPWVNDSDTYDSTKVNLGDTVEIYRFCSKGFWGFNGERMVIGKNGRYYE